MLGDAAGQGSRRSLQQKIVIEDQQIRATSQGLITHEGTLRAVKVGQGSPTGTGGGTQRHRDAGDIQPVCKKLSRIQDLSTTCSDHRITAQTTGCSFDALQVLFAAIMVQKLLLNSQSALREVPAQLCAEIFGGLTAAEHKRLSA